jgi:Short C-terminal domain
VFGNKKKRDRVADLVETGSVAIGTVLDVVDTGLGFNDGTVRVSLRFRIEPLDGSVAFEAEKAALVSRLRVPRVGARYPIFFDPAEPEVFAYVHAVADQGARQLILSKFGDAFGPEGAGVGAVRAPAPADLLDTLRRLGELRDSGVLTEEEFAAQKAVIIGSA